MKVKVCGMRESENISALCKLPIDYIGFIFYPKSPRFVGEDFPVSTANLVPSHIKRTGVFVNAELEYIQQKISVYGLQAVQLHGTENQGFCMLLKNKSVQVIKAFGVDENFNFDKLEEYKDAVDFFLFDTKSPAHGGTGVKFDWSILNQYKLDIPIFLSGGIGANDADMVKSLRTLDIYCLDLNSKFEKQPALKDIDMLQSFISQVK